MSIQARFCLPRSAFTLDVALELPERGVTALFGHSGSGKTTCLRCFAGLERSPEGLLEIHGECWQDSRRAHFVPPHKRSVGYVFQDANLFPHLDTRRNLQFGLRRTPPAQRRVAWTQVIELLGLGSLLERFPGQLSGGERQRVAIGRALLTSPRLLLMDEPLASLDRPRRQELLPYLERLHDELDIPLIYVSHSLDEVARLADHLVLLEQGRACADGPLAEMLLRADLPFIAEQDAGAVVAGIVERYDDRYGLLHIALADSPLHLCVPHMCLPQGHAVRLKVRARDISLALVEAQDSSLLNLLKVQVRSWVAIEEDTQMLVYLSTGGQQLLARITRFSFERLQICAGQWLWAQIKSVSLLS